MGESNLKVLLVGRDDLETNRVLDFLSKLSIPHDYWPIEDEEGFDSPKLPALYCGQYQLYGAEEICENVDAFYEHTKEWFESH